MKNYFNDSIRRLRKYASDHSSEILAGLGIGGFITATVSAVKATPKAMDAIEKKKEEKNVDELTALETVKVGWRYYTVPVIISISSTLCVVSSVSKSLKKNAAIATAYEITRNLADEYKSKVIETIGEKKNEKIESAIRQDRIDNNPPQSNVNVLVPPEDGKHRILYYEPITKQYFWEKYEKFEKAAINAMKESKESFENQYSAYSWISKLPISVISNLPDSEIDYLMNIGWPTTSIYGDEEMLYITTEAKEVTKGEWEGYPCSYIKYGVMPMPNYKSGY